MAKRVTENGRQHNGIPPWLHGDLSGERRVKITLYDRRPALKAYRTLTAHIERVKSEEIKRSGLFV